MKCNKCGNEELLDDDKICSKCGEIIEGSENNVNETIVEDIAKTPVEDEEVPLSEKSFQELEKIIDDENTLSQSDSTEEVAEEVTEEDKVDASNDEKENSLLEEIESEVEEVEQTEPEVKGSNKLKIQLGMFVVGLIIMFVGVSYVNNMVGGSNQILLITSGDMLVSSNVGSKETVVLNESVDADSIQFASGDDNGNIYYPGKIQVTGDGMPEFTLYKNDGNGDVEITTKAEGLFFPNPDGSSVLNFKSVAISYENIIGDLLVHDGKSNTLIEKDVYVTSIKISDDGRYALFTKDESMDLYIYDFKKRSTTKIDEGINGIIDIDENFKNIIYTKANKEVNEVSVSTIYATSHKGEIKKIATNVINGEAVSINGKLIYGKVIDKIPNINDVLVDSSGISEEERENYTTVWENFYRYNFYQLWEVSDDGSNEVMIAENIHTIDFISENGDVLAYTTLKDITEFNKLEKITVEGLSDLSNLEKKLYLGNGKSVYLPDDKKQIKADSANGYAYDEKNKILYYIDSNNLYSDKLNGEELIGTLVDENVEFIRFVDDKLIYNKNMNDELSTTELYQLSKGNKTLIDTNVESLHVMVMENVIVYFKINEEIVTLNQIVNNKSKELGTITYPLMEVSDDILYFVNSENNLMMSKNNKVEFIEENVTNLLIINKK